MKTDPLIQQRLLKRERILDANMDAYARKFDRSILANDVKQLNDDKIHDVEEIRANPQNEFRVCGRLMTFREHGKIGFGQLQDISGRVQICFMRGFTEIAGLEETFEGTEEELAKAHEKFWKKTLDMGDFIGVTGDIFRTKHGEVTILVKTLTFLSKSLRPLPEKWHGVVDKETRYRERYLDLLTNQETFKRMQIRLQVIQEIRHFLEQHQFQEVETRIIQPLAGGAMAKPFMTHHEALDHDFPLRISLEIELKMLITGGIERVYEIGKCFRNEGIDPSHLPEFTMLEWYASYCDIEQNMSWTEEMIKQVLLKVLGTTQLEILNKDNQPVPVDFGKPWKRARFPDLVKEYSGIDMNTASEEEIASKALELGYDPKLVSKTSPGNLLDFIYKKTARPHLIEPTFVLDYPSQLKPLARPKRDGTAECYQLLVAGWEIVNAYGELIDPVVQRKLFEDQMAQREKGDLETMEIDENFLKAMEHGMPPLTGFGMGIDRLVTLITEQPNLRDVILFPLMKPEKKQLSARKQEEIYRSKKIVMIANQELPAGVTANAMGQLGISIGGHSKEKMFETKVLHDADGRIHYTDALYPMANLAGSREHMAEFAKKCYDADIQLFDFSDIMRKAHTDDQMLKGYKDKKTEDIGYIAVGALVPADFEKEFLSGLELFGTSAKEEDVQAIEQLKSRAKQSDVELSEENKKTIATKEDSKKFVAILNRQVKLGRVMNALAHASFGLAGRSASDMHFLEYKDADGTSHGGISHFNTVILKAENSQQIYEAREKAREAGIEFTDFTRTMTLGTSEVQMKATQISTAEDLEYFGICLFGDSEKMDAVTKGFGLWE